MEDKLTFLVTHFIIFLLFKLIQLLFLRKKRIGYLRIVWEMGDTSFPKI